MSRILGLDLSLTATGYAFVEDGEVMDGGVVRSSGKNTDGVLVTAGRLDDIQDQIFALADADLNPDLVVIESPSFNSKFGSQHERAGLWWMVVSVLARYDFPLATVSPNTLKKYATGNGGAGKDAVLAAVVKRYETPSHFSIDNNNVADAVVLAAMGSRHLGFPVEDSLPRANLTAMGGAKWPG